MREMTEEYWIIKYRVVTTIPSELSETFGSSWDITEWGPWLTHDRKYRTKTSAFEMVDNLRAQGYNANAINHQYWHYSVPELG